jgi:glycosyltransferase involved in cell wall biosynthesis
MNVAISLASARERRGALELECRGTWLHLCNGLDPIRDGGMVPSILGMTGGLAALGGDVRIATPTPSRLGSATLPPRVELYGPVDDLESAVRVADVVHLHGLWQGHTRRGARAARQAKTPHLIAAHGMAEPWALRHKAIKKKIYTALVEGKNLRGASCLHALSRPEVGHLRALAPRTPICFVPNGVNPEPRDKFPSRSEWDDEHPEHSGKFLLLFFGRVHAKKGLDLLAPALAAVVRDHPRVHLLLAGNDDGALAPFLENSKVLGVRRNVSVLGHLAGDQARKAWGAADAFVLPSYSEGFSMAILEALAHGLPALVTTACHFPELQQKAAAITVKATSADVQRGLRELLEQSESERKAMGDRGRDLVLSRYTWSQQAERLAEVYRWLSGGGVAPEAVVA